MTYALAHALQVAVFDLLSGDQALSGLLGGAIYDALPPGEVPLTYAVLGDEEVRDASDVTGSGAVHRFTVSVVTRQPGYSAAKEAAGRIAVILDGALPALATGYVVHLHFERARAVRIRSAGDRRIDLRFVARVQQ